MVPVAIAVPFGQVVATAFVHRTRAVAHAARVKRAHTIVDVVANAVGIEVFSAVAATFTDGVRLVPVAIAVAHGQHGASAGVNGARSVADATRVQGADARVFVVADAVKIHVEIAPAPANADGVFLAAETIALAFLDVAATAFVHCSGTVAYPACVQGSYAVVFVVANAVMIHVGRAATATIAEDVKDVAFAVARTFLDFVATAFEDGARTIAFPAFVQLADTFIFIVTDAVAIQIFGTVASTHPQGVFDIAIAVALAVFDFVTATFQHSAWSVAFPALVEFANAFVHVVANAVLVGIRRAIAAAHAQRVHDVAVAVAVASWEGSAPTIVHFAWSVADATSIVGPDAVVQVVAHPVFVFVRSASSTAFTHSVRDDARAAALVNGAGPVANAANVNLPDAFVDVVADAVGVGIHLAIAPAHPCSVWQVSFASAVVHLKVWRDARAVVF